MPTKKQEVDINIKIDLANLSSSISEGPVDSSHKMKTSLTVSQIAFIARILFDSDILSTVNKSDALNKLTNCLVTKNATQISIKASKPNSILPIPAPSFP